MYQVSQKTNTQKKYCVMVGKNVKFLSKNKIMIMKPFKVFVNFIIRSNFRLLLHPYSIVLDFLNN